MLIISLYAMRGKELAKQMKSISLNFAFMLFPSDPEYSDSVKIE